MGYLEHVDLATFITAVQNLRIKTVILAWQEEYGQDPQRETVFYTQLGILVLLAYQGSSGHIVRCQLPGNHRVRNAVMLELEKAGLLVKLRCRNITHHITQIAGCVPPDDRDSPQPQPGVADKR
jgi:hypothetical protein